MGALDESALTTALVLNTIPRRILVIVFILSSCSTSDARRHARSPIAHQRRATMWWLRCTPACLLLAVDQVDRRILVESRACRRLDMLRRTLLATALAALVTSVLVAQNSEPYKLGMFRHTSGRTFPGLVVREATVRDLSDLGKGRDLKDLISQWDAATATRVASLAASVAKQPSGEHVFKLAELKTLAPITNPTTMLNAAVNFQEHANEMARGGNFTPSNAVDPKVQQGIPGMWNRKPGDPRQNPYYFPKMPSAITGNGDPIILPAGRTQIDWECELAVVIGRTAKNITAAQAPEYVFGYTLENDVSDRGGRADGRHGSDWLIGKSHDTFAPLGPVLVPRQFVPNPQVLPIKFTLSGKVMQDSNTDRMTHTVFEMVEFASRILTLRAGDILAMGSPAGVGTARATPIYFKDGDTSVCTIESVGTLTNPVRAERAGTQN
jgi:2-keto-4-pentenoate hydratase/2-oxohepta-3-ene-1,7-dioic acid hydratase in catechol pathway